MKKKPFWKTELFENIVMILVVVAVVLVIDKVILMPTRVIGSSMYPTLREDDLLIVNRLAYRWSGPDRFDIIVFEEEKDGQMEYLIKRVIALPGETVYVADSTIYVDGTKLEEYYWYEESFDGKDMTAPVTLQKDQYFVLGDNRTVSLDSRCREVGLIDRKAIVGKAVFRFLPLFDIGFLKHQ